MKDESGSLMMEFPRLGSRGRRNSVAIPTVRVASPSNKSLEKVYGEEPRYHIPIRKSHCHPAKPALPRSRNSPYAMRPLSRFAV